MFYLYFYTPGLKKKRQYKSKYEEDQVSFLNNKYFRRNIIEKQ